MSVAASFARERARAGSWPRRGCTCESQSERHVHGREVFVGKTGINAAPWKLFASCIAFVQFDRWLIRD